MEKDFGQGRMSLMCSSARHGLSRAIATLSASSAHPDRYQAQEAIIRVQAAAARKVLPSCCFLSRAFQEHGEEKGDDQKVTAQRQSGHEDIEDGILHAVVYEKKQPGVEGLEGHFPFTQHLMTFVSLISMSPFPTVAMTSGMTPFIISSESTTSILTGRSVDSSSIFAV